MHLFHKNMGRLCEKHEKRKKGESVRTTNGHEWQGLTTKNTKYTKKEGRGE